MMKSSLFIFVFFLASGSVFSQSIFQTHFNSIDEEGQLGSMTEISGQIINNDCCTTNKFIQHVTAWDMPVDWLWSQCTPDMCMSTGDSLGFYYLLPSDTGHVSFRFYLGNTPGYGELTIRFADRDNMSDYQDIQLSVWAGVSDLEENAWRLLIYPNPSNDVIYIEGELTDVSHQILDITGKRINHSVIKNGSIDVSELHSGIYFLVLQKNQKKIVKKIVIE